MKTQEALAHRYEDSSDSFPLILQEKKRIETFFALQEDKKRKSFFEIDQCQIGQLDRFEIPESISKDQNPDPEIFEWRDFEENSTFILSDKGFSQMLEILVSCFIPGYWNLHQLAPTLFGGPICQRFSILLFNSEETMKEHLRTHSNMYRFCIDPTGAKHSIQTRIEIDLVKEKDEF